MERKEGSTTTRVLLRKFSKRRRVMMSRSRNTKKLHIGRPSKLKQVINTSKGSMEFLVTDFLKAIEERPVIYNEFDDAESVAQRKIAWKEMAVSLYPKFDKLPKAEQQRILKRLKKNWKDHTTLLLRSVQRKKARDPKFEPYTFRKEMDFFIKFNNINIKDTKYSDEEDVDNVIEGRRQCLSESAINRFIDHNHRTNQNVKLSTSQLSETFSNTSTRHSSENIYDVNSNTNFLTQNGSIPQGTEMNEDNVNRSAFDPMFFCQTTINQSIDQGKSIHQAETSPGNGAPPFLQIHSVHSAVEVDTDRAFFDSIKPSILKIRDSLKLDFKIDVLKLLKKYQN